MKYRIVRNPNWNLPYAVQCSNLGLFWSSLDLCSSIEEAEFIMLGFKGRDKEFEEYNRSVKS